jgi:hypothetical protein
MLLRVEWTRLPQQARFFILNFPGRIETRLMKRWQIIVAIVLVAVFCGCGGILFGFVVGEKIGERSVVDSSSLGIGNPNMSTRAIDEAGIIYQSVFPRFHNPPTAMDEAMPQFFPGVTQTRTR